MERSAVHSSVGVLDARADAMVSAAGSGVSAGTSEQPMVVLVVPSDRVIDGTGRPSSLNVTGVLVKQPALLGPPL